MVPVLMLLLLQIAPALIGFVGIKTFVTARPEGYVLVTLP